MNQKPSTTFHDVKSLVLDGYASQPELRQLAKDYPAEALRINLRRQLDFFDTIARFASESDDAPATLLVWRELFSESIANYRELAAMTEAKWNSLQLRDFVDIVMMINMAYQGMVMKFVADQIEQERQELSSLHHNN